MIDLLIKLLVSIRLFPPAIKDSLISFSITHKRQSIDLEFFMFIFTENRTDFLI